MRIRGSFPRVVAWVLAAISIVGGATAATTAAAAPPREAPAGGTYARDNLVAWCIVPFDARKRTPEERAAMLEALGFKHFAYDWRAEHVPSFDAEVEALKRHHVSLDAFWAPGALNDESRRILDLLKRHGLKAQLWVVAGGWPDAATGPEQAKRVEATADQLEPLAREAARIGCAVGLYNHGGWFGEPENQLQVIEALKARGLTNLGIVYNLHHGHDHLDRLPALLERIRPYLYAVNLNGMDRGGDRVGRKILPLGQGELDLSLLRTIRDSGYRGPIGILGHTMDDAEQRLRDNLDGLDWLRPQLEGRPPGPTPKPRTPVPPRPAPPLESASATTTRAAEVGPVPFDPASVPALLREARTRGDAGRGAALFASPRLACASCHKVGGLGGTVGPELTTAGLCLAPEFIVESVLSPGKVVKEGYGVAAVATTDGRVVRGYPLEETARHLAIRDPSTGDRTELDRGDIEEVKSEGTLMPEGLVASLSARERSDLIRFLIDLGRPGGLSGDALRSRLHEPTSFRYDLGPLRPEHRPDWRHPVNRDRIYDFYAKQAEAFLDRPDARLLPPFPGLDGGKDGHWGNQNEETWADDRWNQADLGSLQCGVFRGAGVTVAKGVCVRLGERGELAACFDPTTLCYEAVWSGGFVRFARTRHGFLDGLTLDGTPLPRPAGARPSRPFVYHGFYRHGRRVIFSYTLDGVPMLDAPWVEDGRFTRVVGPASEHPLAHLTRGGAPQWPVAVTTRGALGNADGAYVVDTIEPPFENPWKALVFVGDHDFFPDGTAAVCTMQGDVWIVSGLDATLENVRWRRFAAGLHHALGLVVAEGKAYVLGRDQITRLHDLDGDGEADYHECVSNAYATSTAGHDFICGLERDARGRFHTSSGPQGLIRVSADGKSVETLASGLRNPDGLSLGPDGTLTAPNSEGEWTPASMVCEIGRGTFFGHGGPRGQQPPDLPLVYLPRGLDNSSGGQTWVDSSRFGPIGGQLLHFSFGAGTWFLVLRDQVEGWPQGAAVPMPGEFRSGAHRGRFNPVDGQLYVSGMAGWGTYTVADGSFQRVRHTGRPAQLPTAFHAHSNGVLLTFSQPIDPAVATRADRQFAQAWNYRYSQGYGSPELSPGHPGTAGHDRLTVRSAHLLEDGKSLFLEIPEIQPVNQLHLHVRTGPDDPTDLYATVHRLRAAFTGFPGYRPVEKTIAAHPILTDMAALTAKPVPNPHLGPIAGARPVTIEAGKNLGYATRAFRVRPNEPIRLTFRNPDVVPHNWVLVRRGALARYGDRVNRIVAEPDAAPRHYVPRTDDLIAYTDITGPGESFAIEFRAPAEPGRYPYLCTFPGHWMVMNGEMIVE